MKLKPIAITATLLDVKGKLSETDSLSNQWWNAVKRIARMATPCGSETLRTQLQIPGTDSLSPHEIANMMKVTFLEPMQTYQSIDPPPPFESIPDLSQVSVEAVSSILKKLPHKVPGPDGIPNWILKEYALILSDPICHIIHCSLVDQYLPSSWQLANIITVPKQSPVQDVNSHLRPISLTPAISKVAEEFVVKLYIASALFFKLSIPVSLVPYRNHRQHTHLSP